MKYWIKVLLGRIYLLLRGAHLSGAYQALIRQGRVRVGKHTYGVPHVHAWPDGAKLAIGSFTSIADEVHILLGGNHSTDWVTTFPMRIRLGLPGAYADGMPWSKGDVTIGSDVWIGHGVTILSGVTIGNGAVVVARSVVVKDVEPYAIAGGAPAKTLRKRFSEKEIAELQALRWWDWPDERIKQLVPLLSSTDLRAFLAACGEGVPETWAPRRSGSS